MIIGIEESIHDILMNLKEIVLKSDLYRIHESSIYIVRPINLTSYDIVRPCSMKIIDTIQHISRMNKSITYDIGLQIEENREFIIHSPNNYQDKFFPIDVIFMDVHDENYIIHSYGSEKQIQQFIFLEICMNGGVNS